MLAQAMLTEKAKTSDLTCTCTKLKTQLATLYNQLHQAHHSRKTAPKTPKHDSSDDPEQAHTELIGAHHPCSPEASIATHSPSSTRQIQVRVAAPSCTSESFPHCLCMLLCVMSSAVILNAQSTCSHSIQGSSEHTSQSLMLGRMLSSQFRHLSSICRSSPGSVSMSVPSMPAQCFAMP